MRIVADRNIPFAEQAFARFGDVEVLPSTRLTREAVRDADLLMIRSTVKAGPALLDGSRVRFVGTATIGIDHLDLAWLDARGIRWAAAPGSNADSVQQWWTAALLTEAERRGVAVSGFTVGIVGVGAVGGRVEKIARALGCEVLLCDPPRARREGAAGFVTLDELVPKCDVVTLHVRLERSGPDATFHLLNAPRLNALKAGAWLINSSRGDVVDGAALAAKFPAATILDVFEGEPAPSPALVAGCALATPHIAGHSLDGKANGTQQLYDAACDFLGERPSWSARALLPPHAEPTLHIDAPSDQAAILAAIRHLYRIETDDSALREMTKKPDSERAAAFQNYRDHYPPRREFHGITVDLARSQPIAARVLTTLGARVVQK